MISDSQPLTYKRIAVFWYPLAATWLMMSLENPFIAAIIARLPEPKYNLAAFGVAFAFALIIEAPVIMLMSASTALVRNREAFFKLRRFTYLLNGGITVVMLVVLTPPVFYHIAEILIGLPHNVAQLTHISSVLLLPWPAAIGYRRFYQGILIRFNLTRRVAYGTVVRLISMAVTALILYILGVPGAYVGAAALSVGVILEALASRFMVDSSLKELLKQRDSGLLPQENARDKPLTYGFIATFYYPLALMSILALGVHPLVTFFVGKSRFAIESLAVLPVINALGFMFRSVGLSYTEVMVALLGKNNEGYVPLRNFAWILGVCAVAGLAVVAFTPLSTVWFGLISGLSVELTGFASLPTMIITLLPGLTVLISFQRSLLMNAKTTAPISWATAIEVTVIIGVLFAAIIHWDMIGAVAAVTAIMVGRLCANLFLVPFQLRAVRAARR